jgi:hypothetical protein
VRPSSSSTHRALGRAFATLAIIVVASRAGAQVVKITTSRILPFEGIGVASKTVNDPAVAKAASTIALYTTAFLGAPGTIGDVPAGERVSFRYVTVHLLFSAAALPMPHGTEIKANGNLQRLNGHVAVVPLDSTMKPLDDLSSLAVLATFPDTILLQHSAPDSGTVNAGRATVAAATRTVLPEIEAGAAVGKRMGSMVASFDKLFHRPTARVQVAYVSDLREFGWMWHAVDAEVIEGTHRASAALEVAPNVRYLSIKLRVVADWRSHGAWARETELVLDVGRPPPATP